MMHKKHCLFCNELVIARPAADYDRFIGCLCAPGQHYSLHTDSYAAIQAFSYARKRELFPIISAYIREQTDRGERVSLTLADMEQIVQMPDIPESIEDKQLRLLQFLHRHSEGPGTPVPLHPLSQHFNLTYSPNMQELVYIIEKLRSEELIGREGGTLSLTEGGWAVAAKLGGDKRKACLVLLPEVESYGLEWAKVIFPKLEQHGYEPSVIHYSEEGGPDACSPELVAQSKLIIADATRRSPEVYFAAGYGLALNIPLVWTVHRDGSEQAGAAPFASISPIVWDTVEQLSDALSPVIGKRKAV
jgi:hypothetical protein